VVCYLQALRLLPFTSIVVVTCSSPIFCTTMSSAVGKSALLGSVADFMPPESFQRWLATGERRVFINYATDLARLIPAKAVRLRRDIGQLLRAIKVHALLHRKHRKRGDKTGAIIATFGDYKAVRELMVDTMSESAEVKARKTLPETVEAVGLAGTNRNREGGGATVNEIAAILDIDRSTTKRRLDHAIRAGHVTPLDVRHGRSFLYVSWCHFRPRHPAAADRRGGGRSLPAAQRARGPNFFFSDTPRNACTDCTHEVKPLRNKAKMCANDFCTVAKCACTQIEVCKTDLHTSSAMISAT
jgi:hypothetical protein